MRQPNLRNYYHEEDPKYTQRNLQNPFVNLSFCMTTSFLLASELANLLQVHYLTDSFSRLFDGHMMCMVWFETTHEQIPKW